MVKNPKTVKFRNVQKVSKMCKKVQKKAHFFSMNFDTFLSLFTPKGSKNVGYTQNSRFLTLFLDPQVKSSANPRFWKIFRKKPEKNEKSKKKIASESDKRKNATFGREAQKSPRNPHLYTFAF